MKKNDLELVEAKALVINDLVEQLVLLGIIGPNLITGQVVFQRLTKYDDGGSDSIGRK